MALLEQYVQFKLLDVHLGRVADIALAEPEKGLSAPSVRRDFRGEVELQQVMFRYAPFEPMILKGASLKIKPGEFIAFAAPSGEGKSTLLRLILGLYEPTSGHVLYDGLPVSAWGLGTLRKQMGVVMQDDTLMAGSIAENISLFDDKPDHERIRWAANLAAIHEDIEQMPMSYRSLVGDMGTSLSGGQQQRVMLARALYRKPKLLVMDEGTSQLDIATERRVNAALKQLNITRVAAAHRPETLAAADRVIGLQDGRLAEVRMPPLEPRLASAQDPTSQLTNGGTNPAPRPSPEECPTGSGLYQSAAAALNVKLGPSQIGTVGNDGADHDSKTTTRLFGHIFSPEVDMTDP